MRRTLSNAVILACCAAPVVPATAAQMLVSRIVPDDARGGFVVDVMLVNDGATPLDAPDRLDAIIDAGGTRAITLERAGAVPMVAPGRFGSARYRMILPAGLPADGATVRLAAGGPAYAMRAAPVAVAAAPPATAPVAVAIESVKPETGNAFLGNLSPYAPMYAVYGPGTDTDGRLQFSFKYQLFGTPGAVGRGQPWQNGIHLGYTQRMFWDLGSESSPFRTIDFMPELFYLVPATRVSDTLSLGGQAGFRHESNGRDGTASRSINMLYVQPVATFPLRDYTVSVGPRAWAYVGSLEDNPDIKRYRGNTGLLLEIGKDDGFRLSTTSRLSFGSGKGSIDALLSYPVHRIVDTRLNLYVFGQGFAGYGENLLDYDRRVKRLRVGVGIVR